MLTATPTNGRGAASAPHDWIGSGHITLTAQQARLGLLRASVAIPERTKFVVLEIYCLACRRPYDDVADQPCSAVINNEHLRGGPIGERKKRTPGQIVVDGIMARTTAVVNTVRATGTNG